MFPVRGQPPHIGHILTLMEMYSLYDEIVIAVTSYTHGGTKPQIIPPTESVRILRKVFEHLPKYKVVFVGEGFIKRTHFEDLPHFDVIVAGDLSLIRNMEKYGIKCVYVPRSKISGMDISGTVLRKALNAQGQRKPDHQGAK